MHEQASDGAAPDQSTRRPGPTPPGGPASARTAGSALTREVVPEPAPVPEPPSGQLFDTVEAAIGQVEGRATVVQTVSTQNAGLRARGFTQTVYAVDRNGTQWTVHHNPRTGQYFGAHHSSSN